MSRGVRTLPSGPTYRYSVDFDTPSAAQISWIGVMRLSRARRPRPCTASTRRTSSRSEQPSRSSRHTTSVSPAPSALRRRASPAEAFAAPPGASSLKNRMRRRVQGLDLQIRLLLRRNACVPDQH